ncbi:MULTISPECIES: putative metalloprotease CJM1_0395 family protein [Pseudoalteromonas]|uniref:Catalase n=1 Tax=Pseudoalteromonas amylolytica TaxID=1859457 RepID=A0A1S1MVY0_9GAMM|nr:MULTISPECIES: putative metalloprotease CJM1_0395 family protein [Pseudoalteromonas]MCF6435477.1 catalase [Pseudoalteromonas sp. MMG022]OHU86361.1 catalase [Pseudoalteromonas sp. JW3]OHU89534.1 catalase [Pseudoalteromonas amylolytica]
MNIVTPPPAMNLNTANVYTETAKRDNQLREIIPKAPPTSASFTENKPANEGDKTRASSPDDSSLYTNNGQLAKNKTIEEKEQQGQQQGQQQQGDEEEKQKQDSRSDSEEKAQQQEIKELKARDQEVRLHEQAHARVGGQYAGSPSYEYQRGPDGNNYAVGGEVMIDVAEIPGDPAQTIDKMQTVRAAALAPAEPSGADRAIAADATQKISSAQAELAKQQISGDDGEKKQASSIGTYQTRRLKDEDEEERLVQRESATLKDDADPYAVALPIERDPQIQARALRINDFYQHIASPDTPASLSLRV